MFSSTEVKNTNEARRRLFHLPVSSNPNSNNRTHNRGICQGKQEQETSVLPLATSSQWYAKQGELSMANKGRSERRRSAEKSDIVMQNEVFSVTRNSSTSQTLSASIAGLEDLILTLDDVKRKACIYGVLAVARCLKENFPIMKTQKASSIYKGKIKEILGRDDQPDVRTTSSEVYDMLSKYLNIMHLYIKGTGFIMECKDSGPLQLFLDSMSDLLGTNYSFRADLNKHVEDKIGDTYHSVLSYVDTESDRNTMKYILTRITSVNFMARLQNTQNKSALQRCRDIVPLHLRQFERLRENTREMLKERQLTKRQERYLLKRTLQIEKMRVI